MNELALGMVPISHGHWLTKHISGIYGVGKMIKIWGKQAADECHCCVEREMAAHVIVCDGILW